MQSRAVEDCPRPSDSDLPGLVTAQGDDAQNTFWVLVYDELRRVAQRRWRGGGETLPATALVHEVYLRLANDERVLRHGRAYFFGAASQAMRQVAVDHARRRSRAKRGGQAQPITLKTHDAEVDSLATDLLDVHHALERLERLNERQAQVVEYRFFGGLTVREIADALSVSTRTVKRDWMLARAWLFRELQQRAS